MKVCITSQGKDLESQVDPRFGRCQYYIIYNVKDEDFNVEKNPYINAAGGAGIQAGQMIIDKKVEVILTGNVGPNAFRTLNAGGIEVVTGISGSVKEAIQKYKKGEWDSADSPTVDSKFGVGKTGKGRNINIEKNSSESQQKDVNKQELKELEEEVEELEQKAEEMRKKLDEEKNKEE